MSQRIADELQTFVDDVHDTLEEIRKIKRPVRLSNDVPGVAISDEIPDADNRKPRSFSLSMHFRSNISFINIDLDLILLVRHRKFERTLNFAHVCLSVC